MIDSSNNDDAMLTNDGINRNGKKKGGKSSSSESESSSLSWVSSPDDDNHDYDYDDYDYDDYDDYDDDHNDLDSPVPWGRVAYGAALPCLWNSSLTFGSINLPPVNFGSIKHLSSRKILSLKLKSSLKT